MRYLSLILSFTLVGSVHAQLKWHTPPEAACHAFYTDAPHIAVRYTVKQAADTVALYRIDSGGEWEACPGVHSRGDTLLFSYHSTRKDKYHHRGFEYRLYLPPRGVVEWLEVGIPEANELTVIPPSPEKPLIVYGADCPAISWGEIRRSLDYPLLFPASPEEVGEREARLYLFTDPDSCAHVRHAVAQIRAKGQAAPILFIDRSSTAAAVEKQIRDILRIPVGTVSTTIPVTQRREPDNYEWRKRHDEILSLNRKNPPRAVILGNSITHFWGGEPAGPRRNGTESWNAYMQPLGFRNLGYGWDRIENVLWRVYHDELDGYEAERVILMIGTNNMGICPDDEIVDGLRFLLSAISERQPKATIKVIGILPRRDQEKWVNRINLRIEEMTKKEGHIFQNAGNILLNTDGKIDESLFLDGLHPNEKGYDLLGILIAE
ncbi:MAG: SGNH/GDSL hydrolase family protein [Tannerellaceae bacterium]|jgi:lysophospholipase L1-like esterase|nr:SGNH/GDSL hydrolase family protein [Tannerellaceae bacterium]